ncbi:hypothetical protein KEM52_005725 [Ascosphaera acerosa]|nr:hypothetical protein KEM52_005725 [Ascosphaera acerosa]
MRILASREGSNGQPAPPPTVSPAAGESCSKQAENELVQQAMREYFARVRDEPGFLTLGGPQSRGIRARAFRREPDLVDRFPNGRYTWGRWHFEVRHDGLHFLPLDQEAFLSLFVDHPSAVIPMPGHGIHVPPVPPELQPVRIPSDVYATGSNFWERYWRLVARPGEIGKPQAFCDEEAQIKCQINASDSSTDHDSQGVKRSAAKR